MRMRAPRTDRHSVSRPSGRAIPLSTGKTPSTPREQGGIEAADNAAKVSEIQLNHMLLRLCCPFYCLAVCTNVGTPHGPKRLGIPGWSAGREGGGEWRRLEFFQQESERGQFVTGGMNGTAQVRLAEAATVLSFESDHLRLGRLEV